tara:strand:+ start:1013402 stop:1014343 length:942 start_codon:yes stop_codon:yes gene_type:complete
VLLVVLGVIILVVTVLGLLAKVSLRRGVQAVDAQLALQQRWGAMTMQRALLNRAPKVFEQRDEKLKELGVEGEPPPPFIRSALSLGGVTFDLMLADEDAKLNLNALYHQGGLDQLTRALDDVVPAAGREALRLLPAVGPMSGTQPKASKRLSADSARSSSRDDDQGEDPEIPPAFRSWGEVFDIAKMSASVGSDAALPNLTTGMTCWGSGQLNIRRASDASILAVVGSVIQDGGAARFLKRYRDNPASDVKVLLVTEVKNEGQRDQLAGLVAEASTNFSLWIDASVKSGRPLRDFIVTRRDEEGVIRIEKFAH